MEGEEGWKEQAERVRLAGQRGTLIAAGGLGLTTFSLVDAKIFIRVSFAGMIAAAVVLYQAHRIRVRAISAGKC